ncbi:MAG TPA: cation:proton antiporter [Planctomycetaceae bacterium]|nr:cation:proton antiporter [Planctomycetaceae bacterium]HQZ63455.1 cation:proton antiporter [Planctomycetaceae bacterium]
MSLTTSQTANVLLALALLLTAAHGFGFVFAKLRQPRVIGEIFGGLLLGPSCLGYFAPNLQELAFVSNDGVTFAVLGAIYQLGLLLLMFCSGLEVRSGFQPGERKTAMAITVAGTTVPFLLGILFLRLHAWTGMEILDLRRFHGTAQSDTAFLLVFAIAVAVTSIPVISRIMYDLGVLETSFARVVLGAAVIEDIILYVVLAIAIGLVGQHTGDMSPVQQFLGATNGSTFAGVFHLLAPVLFFGVSLFLGRRAFHWIVNYRYNVLIKSSPIGFLLLFMLTMTGICVFMGVTPMFGAFVAGMVAGTGSDAPSQPRHAIKSFSIAFFVPVYFAIVGLKLDLIRAFEPLFFLVFLVFACGAKSLSVYAGARIAGEPASVARNLAVAMNARGGPGIVLASVAYDAHVVNEGFYVSLVMLAILTSLLAGSYLANRVASGYPLR